MSYVANRRGMYGLGLALILHAGGCSTASHENARAKEPQANTLSHANSKAASRQGAHTKLTKLAHNQRSIADAYAALQSLALSQESNPDKKTSTQTEMAATAFERMINTIRERGNADRFSLTFEQVQDRIAPSPLPSFENTNDASGLSDAQKLERIRNYVSGRAKLVDGDASGALEELAAVVALDETSGDRSAIAESLGMLAEAQVLAGKRASGLANYQRAVEIGLDDPRVHAFLGRELVRSRRFEEAASRLLRAADLARTKQRSLTLAVSQVDLADTLLNLGYITAAGQLLTSTLTSLDPVPPVGMRAEEAELYRKRAELWQRAGDLAIARGDTAAAEHAIESASHLPGIDANELQLRSIRTLLSKGYSARAALVTLDIIAPNITNTQSTSSGLVDNNSLSEIKAPPSSFACAALLTHLVDTESSATLYNVLLAIVSDPATNTGTVKRIALASSLAEQTQNRKLSTLSTPTTTAEAKPDTHVISPVSREILAVALARFPDSPVLLSHLITSFAPSEAAELGETSAKLCELHPVFAPTIAQELVVHGIGTKELLDWATQNAHDNCGAWMIATLVRSLLDSPIEVTSGCAESQVSAYVTMHAYLHKGKWQEAVAAADQLSHDSSYLRASSLGENGLQRPVEAFALIPGLVAESGNHNINGVTFYQAAQFALHAGAAQQAEAYLQRAKDEDPADERVYEQLLALYAPKGPLADESKLVELARDLREHAPESTLVALVTSRDALSRQRYTAAAEALSPVLSLRPAPMSAYALAVAIASSGYTTQPYIVDEILTFVDSALVHQPDSPVLLCTKARLLAIPAQFDDAPDKTTNPQSITRAGAETAEQLLSDAYHRLPLREIARVREQIVAEALGDNKRASDLRLQRLESSSRDLDYILEYAGALIQRGDLANALLAVRDELPPLELSSSIGLLESQKVRLRNLASHITPKNLQDVTTDEMLAAPGLLDAIEARVGALPREAAIARIALLCTTQATDPQRVLEAVKKAVAGQPELKSSIITYVPQLLAKRNTQEAIGMIGTLAQDPQIGSPELVFTWFRAVFIQGDAATIRAFVKDVQDPLKVLTDIAGEGEVELGPDSSDEARRAELAYWVGNATSSIARDEQAMAAYRIALEYAPDHPWSLNNLGYNLLENDNNITEAGPMIERAAVMLPDEPSVIDSLGWLQYRRGEFELSAETLQRAVDHPSSSQSAEKLLHLGDARWRLSQSEAAVDAWERGNQEIQNTLSLLRAQQPARLPNQPPPEPSPMEKRAIEDERQITSRLAAAREKRKVAVASTHEEQSKPGGARTIEIAGPPD